MKAKLIIKKVKDEKGFPITKITHIKLMNDNGKYIKFLKHDDDLIEFLQQINFNLPEKYVNR